MSGNTIKIYINNLLLFTFKECVLLIFSCISICFQSIHCAHHSIDYDDRYDDLPKKKKKKGQKRYQSKIDEVLIYSVATILLNV